MSASDLLRIGWIGTGVMGEPMCAHLLDAGHPVGVYSRTRERASGLLDKGAEWCDEPAAAAADADVVCTMVGYPADVREAVLGEAGVLAGAREGAVLVDFTTSSPTLAVEIAAAASEQGVSALDAPVSGGDVGARNASLVVMVGGDQEAFERARPVLDVVGGTVVLEGGPGSGQHVKMVNQITVAAGMIGLCEGLLYASQAGLDLERTLETIGGGAAGSWSLENLAPRILRGDLEPGFKVDHMIKDLGLALEECRRMGLALPGLALAEQLYVAASAEDLGEKGTQALVVALASMSDVDWQAEAAAS